MFTRQLRVVIFAFLLPVFSAAAEPETDATPDYAHETLTGDWGGLRTKLYNAGVDARAIYTGDVLSNVSGGIKRGTNYIDNLDLQFTFDGSKLYDLEGSTIFIYLLNNNGPGFNRGLVGSGEGVDNIEVTTPGFKLYEAWIEQTFADNRFSLRGGLYDVNSEFYITDSSDIFISPTFGMDTALAATGQNGPSIFPTTSLGIRAKYTPNDNWYFQAAVLDGVPGIPGRSGTAIDLREEDGVLVVGETGYGQLASGKVGIGGWWYSKRFDHLSDVDSNGNPTRKHGDGLYLIAEKTLYTPDASGKRHLDGFLRLTGTPGDVSNYDGSLSTGVSYTGPFASRPDDIAGFAAHGAHTSDANRRANRNAGTPITDGEWGLEATYAAQLTPWLNLQPDLQYINNPGSSKTVDDAWVVSARMGVNF